MPTDPHTLREGLERLREELRRDAARADKFADEMRGKGKHWIGDGQGGRAIGLRQAVKALTSLLSSVGDQDARGKCSECDGHGCKDCEFTGDAEPVRKWKEGLNELLDEAMALNVDPEDDLHDINCGITPEYPNGLGCTCGVDAAQQSLEDRFNDALDSLPTPLQESGGEARGGRLKFWECPRGHRSLTALTNDEGQGQCWACHPGGRLRGEGGFDSGPYEMVMHEALLPNPDGAASVYLWRAIYGETPDCEKPGPWHVLTTPEYLTDLLAEPDYYEVREAVLLPKEEK